MWAAVTGTILGAWLMIAPALFDLSGAHRTSLEVVGPLVATVGAISISQVTRAVRWLNVVFGVWVIIAPFALGSAGFTTLHDVLVGAAIVWVSLVRGQRRWKQGGGFRSLRATNASQVRTMPRRA